MFRSSCLVEKDLRDTFLTTYVVIPSTFPSLIESPIPSRTSIVTKHEGDLDLSSTFLDP